MEIDYNDDVPRCLGCDILRAVNGAKNVTADRLTSTSIEDNH